MTQLQTLVLRFLRQRGFLSLVSYFINRAEQEILLRRSLALAHGDEYKLSGRRSFFRRSKKGSHGMSVNHSREGSDSATSITTSCTGKEGMLVLKNLSLGIYSYEQNYLYIKGNLEKVVF